MGRKKKTMDGNNAAAYVSYAFTDVAAIFPITPSSVMAEVTDKWASEGKKNIFNDEVRVVEMQSEAGAAGAVHGSLAAGALTTTYTASQGLLLMIPNLYKIAGELLPCVVHVSARTLATHALSIFGDHQDVYACRQTGCAMICAGNVQEVMDLGAVAHLATIKGRIPVIHFFDGFRTSHELQKIEVWDDETLKNWVDMDAVDAFRRRGLNPEHPVIRGTAQNPDIFFQAREACNTYYDEFPAIVEEYMEKVNAEIGTNYKLFNYYGDPEAESVIVAMGSVCDTARETIDFMLNRGDKVGLITVRLYRPWVRERFLEVIPKTTKVLNVLDRTKEPGSLGEPLYLDVLASLKDTEFADLKVNSGRYGLSSKDTNPAHIIATFKNTERSPFTIGIVDDVTNLSLPVDENPNTTPEDIINCKFWGLGADGTVGANKNSIKIIGDHTDQYVQAYFAYDSKKSGGITISHLRFGHSPIRSTYFVNKANFVACHNQSYVRKYNMVQDLVDNGTFLLNTNWSDDEIEQHLPGQVKKYMADHNIKFYAINGIEIGKEIGLGGRINTVLQSAFFQLAKLIPTEDAIRYMKDAATASYGSKGEAIVKMNHDAIDAGANAMRLVPVKPEWTNCESENLEISFDDDGSDLIAYVNNVQNYVNSQSGDDLPVSAFTKYADGHMPLGSAALEKRGIGIDVPEWVDENCIQCNLCSFVCPHACIRPMVMTEEQLEAAPTGTGTLPMSGLKHLHYRISVSQLDCTGCGACANVCPGKKGNKALLMKPLGTQVEKQPIFDYGNKLPVNDEVLAKFKPSTVKGSQFRRPLMEYSGACPGCGETPYVKLITQLFGERMVIANATGCTSIWGGSSPATPYTVSERGRGPAWANSLFEDNAEYGYGMFLAHDTIRNRLIESVGKIMDSTESEEIKEAAKEYLESVNDGDANQVAADKLYDLLRAQETSCKECDEVLTDHDFLAKKSHWIFGGDGWAYDIGFGGLDHTMASGHDVNICVLDTEVYSNTGGQSSKATNTGAVAQFAAAGKETKKKDLAQILMSYGYVYVAQVAMGANNAQCIKAIKEAESYDGPSCVICYSPCIAHGIKKGLVNAQSEEKKAVEAGYWHLFRFDPRLADEGKNPFQLDSKKPKGDYQEFIRGEVRYNSLLRKNPERAEELFAIAEKEAKRKYEHYLRLSKLYEIEVE
ncbi:MAG: pyruvate:ferredoxin (flavodoxin) oxidoreductase [Eubacteriales bacterium]|nr:pyruvate:ferredoxin (flavodoxin) oxidoreductase [Eubacteriales bacterium]